jgi:hypothetical protein
MAELLMKEHTQQFHSVRAGRSAFVRAENRITAEIAPTVTHPHEHRMKTLSETDFASMNTHS